MNGSDRAPSPAERTVHPGPSNKMKLRAWASAQQLVVAAITGNCSRRGNARRQFPCQRRGEGASTSGQGVSN